MTSIEQLLKVKEDEHIERKSAQYNFHFDEFLALLKAQEEERSFYPKNIMNI